MLHAIMCPSIMLCLGKYEDVPFSYYFRFRNTFKLIVYNYHRFLLQINGIFVAPSMAIEVIKVGRPDGVDTTSLWAFLTGGCSISKKNIEELRDVLPGTFVLQVYGQSEVAGVLTQFRVNDVKETLLLHRKPTSVGKIVPGLTCKVSFFGKL